jgi:hypothetical protein
VWCLPLGVIYAIVVAIVAFGVVAGVSIMSIGVGGCGVVAGDAVEVFILGVAIGDVTASLYILL